MGSRPRGSLAETPTPPAGVASDKATVRLTVAARINPAFQQQASSSFQWVSHTDPDRVKSLAEVSEYLVGSPAFKAKPGRSQGFVSRLIEAENLPRSSGECAPVHTWWLPGRLPPRDGLATRPNLGVWPQRAQNLAPSLTTRLRIDLVTKAPTTL